MEKEFKMDRSIVSKSTFKEADDHVSFFKNNTPAERLAAANEIIKSIFNIGKNHKMNRLVTSSRKHVK